MGTTPIDLCEPPYTDTVPYLNLAPPVGAIAVSRLDSSGEVPRGLFELMERAPWTNPCLVLLPSAVSPALLQAVWGLPIQPAFVIVSSPADRVRSHQVVAAVVNRPQPTVPSLISYVVRRTASIVLGQTLQQIWDPRGRDAGGNAERTIRYRLHRLGGFGRHDWVRIHRLIRARLIGNGLTVDGQAHAVGTEGRTFRAWVARYLGVPMKSYRTLVGWEWILETALRRGGFASLPEAKPVRIRQESLV